MDNSIYEVDREEYKSFIGQLNKDMMDTEVYVSEDCVFTKIFSKKTKKHLSSRINNDILKEEHYFIFNYPDDDERVAPKPILKMNLETREEVQEFFNVLARMQKEKMV